MQEFPQDLAHLSGMLCDVAGRALVNNSPWFESGLMGSGKEKLQFAHVKEYSTPHIVYCVMSQCCFALTISSFSIKTIHVTQDFLAPFVWDLVFLWRTLGVINSTCAGQ